MKQGQIDITDTSLLDHISIGIKHLDLKSLHLPGAGDLIKYSVCLSSLCFHP